MSRLDDIKKFMTEILSKIKTFDRTKLKLPAFRAFFRRIFCFIGSWWHVLLLAFVTFIFLYYPLGGWMIHKIDKTTDYEINHNTPEQSAAVEMMSFIINREVNDKMWTPNLPFFFPSYFLDNMPNFQLGMISGVSTVASAMSNRLDSTIAESDDRLHLKNAAQLLKYDGRIWMFSPANHFTPVPSAHSQYRKARKQLIKFNQELSSGHNVFYKSPGDLAYFLTRVNKSLQKSLNTVETQIREESSAFVDFKADNVFYYNQGKLYSFYLLLTALGSDYKEIIVKAGLYQEWTHVIKALENGSKLDAFYIRNGSLDAMTAPNHLNYLAFYILKAINMNKDIIAALEKGPKT